MSVSLLKTAGFDAAIKEGKVLVDFYADWCGPCAMLSPLVDKVSAEYKDVSFYKLNIDHDMSVALKYNIMSIPALLCFKDGEVVHQIIGFMEEAQLKEELNKAFA